MFVAWLSGAQGRSGGIHFQDIHMKIDHYHNVHILESMMLNHISQEKYYQKLMVSYKRYSSFFNPSVAILTDGKHNIYCTAKYSWVKVYSFAPQCELKNLEFVLDDSWVNVPGYIPPPAARLWICVRETVRESSASCLISQRAKASSSLLWFYSKAHSWRAH